MGHTVQKYFNFLTSVEIIFRYNYLFFEFWDPLGPLNKQNEEK